MKTESQTLCYTFCICARNEMYNVYVQIIPKQGMTVSIPTFPEQLNWTYLVRCSEKEDTWLMLETQF